jgi:hypothetical protein
VTVALQGFPGKPKMSFFIPLKSQDANVAGFLLKSYFTKQKYIFNSIVCNVKFFIGVRPMDWL